MAKTVKRHPFQRDWKRDLLIAALASMLLAIILLLYTFGFTSDFIFKVFNAFLVFFFLICGIVFFIIPAVNWLFRKVLDKKGASRATAPKGPKRNLPKNKPKAS